jgi:hypothetical protein
MPFVIRWIAALPTHAAADDPAAKRIRPAWIQYVTGLSLPVGKYLGFRGGVYFLSPALFHTVSVGHTLTWTNQQRSESPCSQRRAAVTLRCANQKHLWPDPIRSFLCRRKSLTKLFQSNFRSAQYCNTFRTDPQPKKWTQILPKL